MKAYERLFEEWKREKPSPMDLVREYAYKNGIASQDFMQMMKSILAYSEWRTFSRYCSSGA